MSRSTNTVQGITPISNAIDVKYHLFKHNVRREYVIQNIEYDNQKADIFTIFLQVELFVRIRRLKCGW